MKLKRRRIPASYKCKFLKQDGTPIFIIHSGQHSSFARFQKKENGNAWILNNDIRSTKPKRIRKQIQTNS